jgi:hypothetical protein
VTGVALDSCLNLVYSPNEDGYIRIESIDFPDKEYFHVDNIAEMILVGTMSEWLYCPLGVTLLLRGDLCRYQWEASNRRPQLLCRRYHSLSNGKL